MDDSWEHSYETKTDTSANNESAEFDDYEVDGDLYKDKEFIPEPTREVSWSFDDGFNYIIYYLRKCSGNFSLNKLIK